MSLYKGHPIYRVAAPAPENRWYSRGLVFDHDLNQTVEMKRIECWLFGLQARAAILEGGGKA